MRDSIYSSKHVIDSRRNYEGKNVHTKSQGEGITVGRRLSCNPKINNTVGGIFFTRYTPVLWIIVVNLLVVVNADLGPVADPDPVPDPDLVYR
jgi:hypothetical protein